MRVEPSSGNCGGGGRSNDIGVTSRECGWIDVAEQPLKRFQVFDTAFQNGV